jgi:PAB-dependent poly(A)-specific ribonuclease subunit 3
MVYDYHPLAVTLSDMFFKSRTSLHRGNRPNSEETIEEETIWSFIIQIANAMKNIHDRNLALRTVDATKILVTGKNR